MSFLNYLFLDIDGVLNSRYYMTKNTKMLQANRGNPLYMLDPEACSIFQEAIDQVPGGVELVISSTWRFNHPPAELQKLFAIRGIHTPILGYTPEILTPHDLKDRRNELQRGLEIQWWLRTYCHKLGQPGIVWDDISVAILDDDSDMGDLLPLLTQTRFQTGLTEFEVPFFLQKYDKTLRESRAAGLNGEILWEHDALAMQVNSHRPGWHGLSGSATEMPR